MKVDFSKYHGTGNDFILIDDRKQKIDLEKIDIPTLADRHFGIGSDGVIIIRNHPDLDFEMIFFNPDGSQSFCGNGSRCAMQFAIDLGIVSDSAAFMSTDGVHEAFRLADGRIKLQMHDAPLPVSEDGNLIINTGSPHFVKFGSLEGLDIIPDARKIRYNDKYRKDGINVNFVEQTGDHEVTMRTYERGVENETLSCGTGVTAAALTTFSQFGEKNGPVTERYRVKTRGGDLEVEFYYSETGFNSIYLIGPAMKVFEGNINI